MRGTTHLLGGLAAGVVLLPHVGDPLTLLAAATFGGLIPDWDHPRSLLGRWIPWPAVSHSRGPSAPPAVGRVGWPHTIWHRHQAHSVVGLALAIGVLTGLWMLLAHWHWIPGLGWPVWLLGLGAGGLSHLILDGFNIEGQWWLWPVSRHGFRWPIHGSVRRVDALAFWGLVVLLAVLHRWWVPTALLLLEAIVHFGWHAGLQVFRVARSVFPWR